MDPLRHQLLKMLEAHWAHMPFDDAVAGFPEDQMNAYPPNVPYTPWHILEHLRLTQFDILDYIRNPQYTGREWPAGYWPAKDAKADKKAWDATIAGFKADLEALCEIVKDENTDFNAPIPHGWQPDHTILRELLVVADHNAYHIGEFAILRQVMGTWPKDRKG